MQKDAAARIDRSDDASLAESVKDARARTIELVRDLPEDLLGARLPIVNPLRWEIGHAAWFQEFWVLRHVRGQRALRPDADRLYDSAAIDHEVRWDLPLPSRAETFEYLSAVRDRVLDGLPQADAKERYFVQLSVLHEDMHGEAIVYTRQTLGHPAPRVALAALNTAPRGDGPTGPGGGPLPGDVRVPGGVFELGASVGEPFVFDNEKWAHDVEVAPFRIARAAVTQSEFAAFVDDGGYRRREHWSGAGWQWREATAAEHPVYWSRSVASRTWLRRDFDRWVDLEPHRPVLHVSWFEAEAFCRWAGRRLPTELEWEVAAAGEPAGTTLARIKRRFPWGDTPPSAARAVLDGRTMGALDVGALPDGDSAFGCRQMIGNTWEWTASDFVPYPAFERDPYKEYSEPWFGTHKVLRGGAWTTRARLIRNTWRNFYQPHRRDVWAGFRTCAREA